MDGNVTQNKGHQIVATSCVMLVLATTAVALRFWGRHVARKAGFWWDDWTSLAALPFIWTSCALSIYWVSIGLGRHIAQTPEPRYRLLLTLFVVNFIYNTGLSIVKMSVLLFYARIFSSIRIYRVVFWIVGLIIVAWCVAINFLALFACIPVQKAWLPKTPGHCLDSHRTDLGATISNVAIDVIILVLPMPMLWRLKIQRPRKIGLIGVFAAGYCVIILSVLRFASILKESKNLEEDFSWYNSYLQTLVTCEVPVALISSCLPSIFNLAKHGANRYRSHGSLFGLFSASKPLSGPGGGHIGPTGNPVDTRKEKGFVPLDGDTKDYTISNERLFDGTEGGRNHTVAYANPHGYEATEDDSETGIPLRQIHVRGDVRVDAETRLYD